MMTDIRSPDFKNTILDLRLFVAPYSHIPALFQEYYIRFETGHSPQDRYSQGTYFKNTILDLRHTGRNAYIIGMRRFQEYYIRFETTQPKKSKVPEYYFKNTILDLRPHL